MMWIFARFVALIAGLWKCLIPAKSRPAAAERDRDIACVSVNSTSSVNADSALGVFQDTQPTTLTTGSLCFDPAEGEAPTPCSLQSSRPSAILPKQPAAASTCTTPLAATPVPLRPALADISKHNNLPGPTPATVAGSVASCCPSPLVDDYVTPAVQPISVLPSRYMLNSELQVVGYNNTARRYLEDKPVHAHTTPYSVRLEKELEKAVKVEERLATSREKEPTPQ